jgi:translation initiation factor IF-2
MSLPFVSEEHLPRVSLSYNTGLTLHPGALNPFLSEPASVGQRTPTRAPKMPPFQCPPPSVTRWRQRGPVLERRGLAPPARRRLGGEDAGAMEGGGGRPGPARARSGPRRGGGTGMGAPSHDGRRGTMTMTARPGSRRAQLNKSGGRRPLPSAGQPRPPRPDAVRFPPPEARGGRGRGGGLGRHREGRWRARGPTHPGGPVRVALHLGEHQVARFVLAGPRTRHRGRSPSRSSLSPPPPPPRRREAAPPRADDRAAPPRPGGAWSRPGGPTRRRLRGAAGVPPPPPGKPRPRPRRGPRRRRPSSQAPRRQPHAGLRPRLPAPRERRASRRLRIPRRAATATTIFFFFFSRAPHPRPAGRAPPSRAGRLIPRCTAASRGETERAAPRLRGRAGASSPSAEARAGGRRCRLRGRPPPALFCS